MRCNGRCDSNAKSHIGFRRLESFSPVRHKNLPIPLRTKPAGFNSLLSQDCQLCGVSAPGTLCAGCWDDLPASPVAKCPRCAAPSRSTQVCGACLADAPHFDETVSAFQYVYPLDRLVQAYKFSANLGLLPLFAEAVARAVGAGNAQRGPVLVIPLPLAPKRLAERGFNQSALLGAQVSKILGLRFEARGMLRVRETPPQTGLNREARLKNVRGAFDCTQRLDGHVAIVDDVMTTGATLSEAAKVLKKVGAVHVSAWVIARATRDDAPVAVDSQTRRFEGPIE